jgi:uncharacterized membrane protein YraQ (UPF0718 family)
VLWNGGIRFGGVLAFILTDLIVLPILNIYRKYYGWRMAGFLLLAFYIAMAASAFVVELFFGLAGLIPHERRVWTVEASIAWNYTTWLDLAFLLLAAVLIWRFVSIGRRGRFLRCAERFAAGLISRPRADEPWSPFSPACSRAASAFAGECFAVKHS